MILVIGITEVLLARIVSRPHVLLDLDEQLLLERQILEHGLDDVVGIAHGIGDHADGRTRSTADGSSPRSRRLAEDARLGAVEARRNQIVDGDVMAGEREHLGDAVPHQAGTDDGDARLRAIAHPAV